ncbi:hypothetical protein M0R45_035826 [Rubus argutus]|uniref:Uncharacterized protein n=1 Tax=Rubus argutus TaxID=59490 RepID=A0AAW1VYK2_RUBAR
MSASWTLTAQTDFTSLHTCLLLFLSCSLKRGVFCNCDWEREDEKETEQEIGSNGGDEMGKNQRSIFSNIKWGDLLLDPDPKNILAVRLTVLLTWPSVEVLWQILFISLATLVAALKYSFIATVLRSLN